MKYSCDSVLSFILICAVVKSNVTRVILIFSLYSLDPSGTYVRCDAKAIGSGAEGAQGSLGDIYHKDITLKEATKHALTILKQVYLRTYKEILETAPVFSKYP